MKREYTEAELPEAAALCPKARLGVIGNPIAHSISPPMQQAALNAEGREVTYIRLLCERQEGAFARLVNQLRREGFLGANVTVPFKKQAYALADEADALSQLCGAANTLVFKGERIVCHNTDGPGFAKAVQELSGKPLGELRTLVVGACGGAGVALTAQCVLSGCPELTLVNRPRPELEQQAAMLQAAMRGNGKVHALPLNDAKLAQAVNNAELIVNATSLGLAEGDMLPLAPDMLKAKHVVYDLVTHDTPFKRAAEARGCKAANGQEMLLWQGALAYEHWFGSLPPVEAMRRGLAGKEA